MKTSFSIFDRLRAWNKDLEPWEQVCLAKLIHQGEVTGDDFDLIYEQLLICKKLKPGEIVALGDLDLPQTSAEGGRRNHLRLAELRHLESVNALPANSTITFGPQITVIFGHNGAGKSGYARIFKAACFTRSKDVQIIGNVHKPVASRAPKAHFVLDDGSAIEYDGAKRSTTLRDSFAVFDSSCIRVHTDEKKQFNVTPYLFDIFPKMVDVYGRLKEHLLAEATASKIDLTVFQIPGSTSPIAVLANALSANTKMADLEAFGEFSKQDGENLVKLEEQLALLRANKLPELIKTKTRQTKDLDTLKTKLQGACLALGQNVVTSVVNEVQAVRRLVDLSKAASGAQFAKEPVQPIGTEAWKDLILSALQYSEEAYKDLDYKVVPQGAKCVLCHQELAGDAADRLRRFFAHVRDTTEQSLGSAKATLASTRTRIANLDLSWFEPESALRRTAEDIDHALTASILDATSTARAKREELLRFIDTIDAQRLTPIGEFAAIEDLIARKTALDLEIEELQKQDIATSIRNTQAQISLIRDKEVLSRQLLKIREGVESLQWAERAERVARGVTHRHVTEKQRTLMNELIGNGFEQDFRAFCATLQFDLPLNIRFAGSEGTTNRKINLKALNDTVQPSSVLSEGEQTAVALADFLAELKLTDVPVGLVFDDPVTSMDHWRKEIIANTLVEQAKERQVIVFTHDILFTNHLAAAAQDAGLSFKGQTVANHNGEPGTVGVQEFPHVFYEKQSLQRAMQCHQESKALVGEQLKKTLEIGCASLRTAYEDFVLKTLFNDVVGRWRENIRYTIDAIFVDDEITESIQSRLEYLSRFIEGHSHSVEYSEVPLTSDLLDFEIRKFIDIRSDYKKRRKEWETQKINRTGAFS